jgi:hypothetical protein
MPATTKADLLAVTLKEYDLFMQDIARVAPALRLHPDPDAHGTTLKDIVGHRAHWIEMFLTWYHEGAAGHEVAFPAKGYKWNELPRFNADLRAAQSDLTWQDACDMLQRNHARLVGFLNDLSQDQLYGGPMPGAKNHWTTGRWAEAAGPSHYRSARKYLRQRMRSSKNAPAATLE